MHYITGLLKYCLKCKLSFINESKFLFCWHIKSFIEVILFLSLQIYQNPEAEGIDFIHIQQMIHEHHQYIDKNETKVWFMQMLLK